MESTEFNRRTQEISEARWDGHPKKALKLCRRLGAELDQEPAPSDEQRMDQFDLMIDLLVYLSKAKEARAVFERCRQLLPGTTARTRAHVFGRAAEAAACLKRWQDVLSLIRRAVNETLVSERLSEAQEVAERGCELLAGRARTPLRRELAAFVTDTDELAPSPIDLTLAHAAARGQEDVLRELLAQGAAVNLLVDGVSPLHQATSAGHAGSVRALLDAGAWPDRPDARGETALQYAARTDDPTLLDALIDAGASSSIEGYDGASLLHLAAAAGKTNVVRRLLARGMDPLGRDASWRTPADAAAEQGHAELAALLVAAPRPSAEGMSAHYRFRDEVSAARTYYDLREDATFYDYATVSGWMHACEAGTEALHDIAGTMTEANRLSTEEVRGLFHPQRAEFNRWSFSIDRYGRVPGCSHAQLAAAFDRYAHAMARLEQECQAAHRGDDQLLIRLSDGSILRKGGSVIAHLDD